MSQLDEQFDPQLLAALERIKRVSPRNPEAAARGRANFLAYAQSLPRTAYEPTRWSLYSWVNPFSRRLSFPSFAKVLLILGLLVVVTGATVYAAQDSLPDTPLYAVKISSEDIQIALTLLPEAKLELLIRYATRRVDEIAALGLQGIPPPESVTSRLEQQIDQAMELAAETSDPGLVRALGEIHAALLRQLQTVMLARSRAAEPSQSILAQVQMLLEERLRLIELGITDPSGFRLRMRGSGTPASTGEARASATPTAQHYPPSVTLPAQRVGPTTKPTAPEAVSTMTPRAQEVNPTATPAAQETVPAVATPTQEIHLTVTPAEQKVDLTKTPPAQEVHPATTPAGQTVHPTTAPPPPDVHPTSPPAPTGHRP